MAAPGHFRQQSWRRQGARLVPGATPPGAEPLVDKWGQPIEEGEIGIMSDDFYAEAGIPDGVEGKAGELGGCQPWQGLVVLPEGGALRVHPALQPCLPPTPTPLFPHTQATPPMTSSTSPTSRSSMSWSPRWTDPSGGAATAHTAPPEGGTPAQPACAC